MSVINDFACFGYRELHLGVSKKLSLRKLKIFSILAATIPFVACVPSSQYRPPAGATSYSAKPLVQSPLPLPQQTQTQTQSQQQVKPVASSNSAIIQLEVHWHGKWSDFVVLPNGDFIEDKVRYIWVGQRSNIPKRTGCWAFYDGNKSKSDYLLSAKRSSTDKTTKAVIANLNNTQFKQVALECTDKLGNDIPKGADCIHENYFYDKDFILTGTACQLGDNIEYGLRKIKRINSASVNGNEIKSSPQARPVSKPTPAPSMPAATENVVKPPTESDKSIKTVPVPAKNKSVLDL